MKQVLGTLLLVVTIAAPRAHAQDSTSTVATLAADTTLASLVRAALANRPELAAVEASARADAARVSRSRALPDPVLSLGLQNDGFGALQIGRMETSYWSIAASQSFPVAGKRTLRGRVASLAASQGAVNADRVRLATRAGVERAYVDLLLVRDQLAILGRLDGLWAQAEGLARARYESGDGAQSDILRTQLEQSRLHQRRAALRAAERAALAALVRATGRAAGLPLATSTSLSTLADPALPDSLAALADADSLTPELRGAVLGRERSRTELALARREIVPDVTVSGGVMPRGGAFEPMWQAGVSLPLPLWAAGKQSAGVREARARDAAAAHDVESVRRLVRERVEERRAMLAAVLEINRLYRSGLLIQSEATMASALAQYQSGRAPFASVLDALSGWLGDESGYLDSVAVAQRLDIAARELSLDPIAASAAGGMGGAPVPGAGAGVPASPAPAGATTTPAAGAGSPAMPGM